MDIQTYNVKLNMKDSGVVETGIRLKQGDSAMRFAFTITSGGAAYFSESDVPVVYFKRPDGASVFGSAGTELNNYYYEFKGNELQYAGNVICDVKFTLEDGRESTASFSFEVVPDTVTNNSQGHGVYDNDLAEIIADIEEFEPKLEEAVESAEGYATNAYNSAIDAQGYAQEAAAGSGGNELEYTSNQLKLKRDDVVLSTVTISGGGGGTSDYTDLTNKPSINNVTLSGNKTTADLGIVAKDIKTDSNESLQKVIDELASFESITYKGTVTNYASLPSNASNGDMYYVTADAKHYVCVKDDEISLYEWHDYHSFDDGYMVTVEKVKNDTTTTDSGYVLDARVGKALADTDSNIMGGDAYSSTTTYAIGSCCIYENALYKAIQDNVVGIVPTNTSYWEKVTLASLSKPNKYSTTEIAVGTWIDGKTIYRKVFTYTYLNTTGSYKDVVIGNISSDDYIISFNGFWILNGSHLDIGYSNPANTSNGSAIYTASNGNIYFRIGSGVASGTVNIYAILEYTKS